MSFVCGSDVKRCKSGKNIVRVNIPKNYEDAFSLELVRTQKRSTPSNTMGDILDHRYLRIIFGKNVVM